LLSRASLADWSLVRHAIDARVGDLEREQRGRHYPDLYTEIATAGVYNLIKRDFAPLPARMELVIAREEKIPRLLADGKRNLAEVSKVAVDIVLSDLPGIVAFFKTDVPATFSSLKDPALQARLARSTEAAVAALEDYGVFVRKEVQPRAKPSFAIGEPMFREKLRAEEMIDTPIDALLARGEAELKRLQAEFRATAAKIDPKKSFAEVQKEMQKEHPTPDRLIADTQARLAGLRRFLVEHKIVSVPSEVLPRVQETPPFMRALTFASMETPGPFEPKATEAYYNVTLPDPAWPAAQVEDFMRGAFNRTLIDVVSIHEAFPGHYVQFLWLPRVHSKVRKFEHVSSNAEGWAHYCEQMLVDEGYGAGDPKLRLAQLQDALLRAARYVAGIRMHTRGMTLEQSIELFQKEGYQSKKVAEMESRRGTENPTYLYYTLGKLEILRMRDDYKKKLGAAYTLGKFHDAFLAEGAMPLVLVRRALDLD
jgi:uncharacterized protein (DUF885 family)